MTPIRTPSPWPPPALLTKVQAAIAKAETADTLASSLQAIADQTKPMTIVFRVQEDEAATNSALIDGTSPKGQYTGMKALFAARSRLGLYRES